MYGLVNAGNLWYETIKNELLSLKFQQSKNDPCIFMLRDKGHLMVFKLNTDDNLHFSMSESL